MGNCDVLGETCRGDGGSDSDGDVHEGDKAHRGDGVHGDTGGSGETTRGRGRGGRTRTHTHRDSEGQWGELAERVGTRCEQLGVLPREPGEGVCPLEAGHGQVDSVVPREVEGVSAVDGCTRSLGGVKTPGALVEARIPRVSVPVCVVASVVPVCVVSRCVFTSVLNACCDARIPGVKGVVCEKPRV